MTHHEFPAAPRTPLGWFWALGHYLPRHYAVSDRRLRNPWPWPAPFDPERNPVYSYNELDIEAPPDAVFHALTEAHGWPVFYPNASRVVVPGAGGPARLHADARFEWVTFGTKQKSRVTLFQRDVALGWTADSPGTRAFHRWLLEPHGSTTRVVTEECQVGPVASLDRYWMNRSLRAAHQLWLERLRAYVLAGRGAAVTP